MQAIYILSHIYKTKNQKPADHLSLKIQYPEWNQLSNIQKETH